MGPAHVAPGNDRRADRAFRGAAHAHGGARLLECTLETGRTHQIRVHLSAIGNPVVGDGTYGGSRDQIALARPFLHAATLGFDHPATGARMRFEDGLPNELQAVLDDLIERGR